MCLLFICEQPWNEFSTDLGHLHVLLEESVHTCPWQSSGSTQLVNGHPTVLIQQSLHLIPMLEASAWASWAFLVCAWGLQSPCLKSVEPLSHLGASKGVPAKHFLKRSPYLNNWFATSLQELDRGPLLQASGKRSHCHESKKQKKHCRQHGALAALNADASQCCVNANLAVCTQQGHAHSANIAWHAGNMSVFNREKFHKKPTICSSGKQRKTGQEWNSPRRSIHEETENKLCTTGIFSLTFIVHLLKNEEEIKGENCHLVWLSSCCDSPVYVMCEESSLSWLICLAVALELRCPVLATWSIVSVLVGCCYKASVCRNPFVKQLLPQRRWATGSVTQC